MNIKYSFYLLVLFNLGNLSASEKPASQRPICPIDFFNVNQLIVDAHIDRYLNRNSHRFYLQDGSQVEHIDFLSQDALRVVDSYTLLIQYKNKTFGIVDSTKVLNLSFEQLKKLRSSYSQLYPVE